MSTPATSRWLTTDAPTAAVEIAAHRVSVVSLAKAAGGPVVQGWASEPLPAGAIVPSLTSLNVIDQAAVVTALRAAASRAGVRGRRVALVIPDLAAKVSLVPFETVPERREELAQLIAWQMRKAAPFQIEDAQLSFTEGARHGDRGRTFIVAIARQDVVRQYEDVCAAAGLQAGVVDLASFSIISAVLARDTEARDWLLVNTTHESQTLAIVRGDTLMFFRNRPVDGDEKLPDLVHQTAMYYEDRLQGAGFERVVLAGGAAWSGEAVRRGLSERLHAPVASIEPRQVAGFTGREFEDLQPAAADALLAPLGVLVRQRGGNLSTRPFYNERRVHLAVAAVALLVVAFTAWNVTRLVTLSSRRTELRTQIETDERTAADLRRHASLLEKSVDNAALAVVAASAREANAIIDGRTFSWTTFFNRLEDTLPPSVMLSSVSPGIEGGEVVVNMVVIARRAEDVADFIEKLEASGAFKNVLNVNDTVGDDDLHRATLRGTYR